MNIQHAYFFIGLLVLGIANEITAQSIYGQVYDQSKDKPLEGATIYLNNTSIGTITDENGKFVLETKKEYKTSLIISYLGYKTVVINDPYRPIKFDIVLTRQENSLGEVLIASDTWSRAKKLREFKRQFLGATLEGQSCVILNEDDIDLWFEEKNETLNASCDVPIRIKNNRLGYEISYDLNAFSAKYDRPKKQNPYCRFVHYEGSSFYKDLSLTASNRIFFKGKREEAYTGSVMHFMRSITSNSIKDEGFELYNGTARIAQSRVFNIFPEDEESFRVKLKRNFFLEDSYGNRSFVSTLDNEKTILVYKAGNFLPSDAIRFDGDLAKTRVGNQLPLDFELKPPIQQ